MRAIEVEVIRRLTPAQRIARAFELSDWTHALMKTGLRNRHPDLDEAAIERLYLDRLEQCRNRNW